MTTRTSIGTVQRAALGIATALAISSCSDAALIRATGNVGGAFDAGALSMRPQPRLALETCEERIWVAFLQHSLRRVNLDDGMVASQKALCIEIAGTDGPVRSSLHALARYADALQALAAGDSGAEDLKQAASQFGDAASMVTDLTKNPALTNTSVWKDALKAISDTVPAIAHVFIEHRAAGKLCELLDKDHDDVSKLVGGLRKYVEAARDQLTMLDGEIERLEHAADDAAAEGALPEQLVPAVAHEIAAIEKARVSNEGRSLDLLIKGVGDLDTAHTKLADSCKRGGPALKEATAAAKNAVTELAAGSWQ